MVEDSLTKRRLIPLLSLSAVVFINSGKYQFLYIDLAQIENECTVASSCGFALNGFAAGDCKKPAEGLKAFFKSCKVKWGGGDFGSSVTSSVIYFSFLSDCLHVSN